MLSPQESRDIEREQRDVTIRRLQKEQLVRCPKLIGIYSPARQHGKSTVANVLVQAGYKIHKFAGLLYKMWDALLLEAAVPPVLARRSTMDLKETPLTEAGGLSFRAFAEGVGTEWGRKQFHPELWVNINRLAIAAKLARGEKLVVDDMRFPNEYQAIKDLGGQCVRVFRPGAAKPSLPSEGHLQDFEFDFDVINASSKDALERAVRRWLADAR